MKNPLENSIPRSGMGILRMLAIVVTLVAVARICASYHALSATSDEPAHLAAGMQWLDQGKYNLETVHPPVARVATAILPFISGSRSHSDTNIWAEGNKILNDGGHYWQTLTLARLGIMPFFLISVFLLWSWSRKLFGDEVAFLAVLFFTLIPPILAHAGLATTDYPVTAAVLASCYALWWWIQAPSLKRSIVLGVVLGVSIATKFSFAVFFPVAAIVIVAFEFFAMRKARPDAMLPIAIIQQLILVLFAAFIALWACYRFSFGPLPHSTGASYPMPEFFDGLSSIFSKSQLGHAIYFMGNQQMNHGSIWFFPVALALKTPIALLLLVIAGVALIFFGNRSWKTREFLKSPRLLPLLISVVLLAVVIPSDINLGVRNILPIYPFLAMLAALGARQLALSLPRPYGAVGLTILLGWMIVSSFSGGNDRIAYFNEFAGSNPEHYLIDSDLDWGQDLNKLSDTLQAEHVQSVALFYNGSADLSKSGLPKFEGLIPSMTPNSHWVAISKLPLYASDGYKWLQLERPFEKIGNSMLLYHFSDADIGKIRSKLVTLDIADKENMAARIPSADNFLDLSSAYYNAKRYSDCISAARKSLALKPDYAAAYNNIAAGFLAMSQWDSAIAAATEAVRLNPNYQLLKNNLATAEQDKKQQEDNISNIENAASKQPTPENYLNLSATYYNALQYENSIAAARKALALRPDYAAAYNNICAASNHLGNFAEGKKAGDEAVRLEPSNMMFQINLSASTKGLLNK